MTEPEYERQARRDAFRDRVALILGGVLTLLVAAGALVALLPIINKDANDAWGEVLDSTLLLVVLPLGMFFMWLSGKPLMDAERQHQRGSLAKRIKAAGKAMDTASRLVEELSAEMRLRSAELERLVAEANEQERRAAINKEQAEAVTSLVNQVITSTHASMDRRNTRSQLLFFALGAATSIPIGLLVNWWSSN